MKKKIGVIALHGMGTFTPNPAVTKGGLIYSYDLYDRVSAKYGRIEFEKAAVWKEIYYGDIFDKNQAKYIERLEADFSIGQIRRFVIENLGDPAAYAANPTDAKNKVYAPLNKRISDALAAIEALIEPGAPVIVIAHSFGGHVFSNFVWDAQQSGSDTTEYPMANRIAGIVTFGCNIPIFTFAYGFNDVLSIKAPNRALASKHQIETWWRNYFDVDDPLGFPLISCGKGYKLLADKNALQDHKINSGGLFSSWNPFSHSAYWNDSDISDAITAVLKDVLN